MVKKIFYNDTMLAIVVTGDYRREGISFFTPDDLSQQLAYMQHSTGHVIAPHVHNAVERSVQYTKEVLVLRRGKLRVDFYTDNREYVESHILQGGDVILLANGGHGFKVIEDVEMFEIKQGPYAGEIDKTRFDGVAEENVILK